MTNGMITKICAAKRISPSPCGGWCTNATPYEGMPLPRYAYSLTKSTGID